MLPHASHLELFCDGDKIVSTPVYPYSNQNCYRNQTEISIFLIVEKSSERNILINVLHTRIRLLSLNCNIVD